MSALRIVWLALLVAACGGGAAQLPGTRAAGAADRELSPEARLAQGRERLETSEYAKAEADFRAALAGPTRGEAELGLAETLSITGRYAEAVETARAAKEHAPALAERAALIVADALLRSGSPAEAETELRPFEAEPSARGARLALAEILIETGRRRQAQPLLLSLVQDYNEDRVPEDDGAGLALTARAAWLLRSHRDANTLFDAAERAERGARRTLLWRARLFLEKYDPGHAEEVLMERLARAPHDPEALTWLAEVRLDQALDFDEAEQLARAALAQNPKLAPAHFVLAGIALRDMEIEEADRTIAQGLERAPRDLDLLSLSAVARFLADDRAGFERQKNAILKLNPEFSRLYATLGQYADWEHRYREIVELMREALTIDDEDAGALAQLGFNLIRAGDELAGVEALNRSFALDAFNVRVYNTLNLYDTLIPKAYESVRRGRFLFRYHKQDRPLLDRYVPELLERAYGVFAKGYGFEPEAPIGVELYAERESFAVRTSGLPRTAIQGVCFGRTLAAMSPQHESFNLGMTLWHELSHVFHIELSNSRVPRWFTEGLAEHETLVARAEWAREHDAELYAMRRAGRLPSVARMSRAFTRAEELEDIATAYYASSKLVGMLMRRHGRGKLAEMLRAWGGGARTDAVFRQVLGTSLEAVDGEFKRELASALGRYDGQFVPNRRARPLSVLEAEVTARTGDADLYTELARALRAKDEKERAKAALDRALALDPRHAQARFLSARMAAEAERRKVAEDLLRAMVRDGQGGYAVEMLLAELARQRSDVASARAALELAHSRDPTQAEPLAALADLAAMQRAPAEEIARLEKLALLTEHDAGIHQRLVARLLEAKRFEDAVRAGEVALWVDIDGALTHLLLARALAATGKTERARFELESALLASAEPAVLAEVHARLALVLAKLGLGAEGRRHAAEAGKLDPAAAARKLDP